MTAPQNVIAVVFDFDDTLTDDSTTALLRSGGINTDEFWGKKQPALVEQGWDPTPAYLKLLLDHVGDGRPLGKLSNERLREFGAKLEFYPGLPGLFEDLRASVSEHQMSNPGIEFYVISGGMEEVIRGSSISAHLNGFWGCKFAEEDGEIRHIQRVVSFTEKTKYLYHINKGLLPGTNPGPYAVNENIQPQNRRVPFENMIYIGDGFTDVPCFSLITHFGGQAFGVFDAKKLGSPKKAWEKLVAPHRVVSMNAPKYGADDDLGALLRVAVKSLCLKLDAKTRSAV